MQALKNEQCIMKSRHSKRSFALRNKP